MKSVYFTITIIITLLLNFCILPENIHAEYVPGEVLIKYKSGSAPNSVDTLHYDIGSVKKRNFKKIRAELLKLPNDMTVEEAIKYYERDPNVEYAEPNYIVHANTAAQVIPNDTSFSNLWGLHAANNIDIDAPEAWNLTTGSTNVVIAVIDSGVARDHPDFYHASDPSTNNIWKHPGETNCNDNIDNDTNGYVDDCYGWDFLNEDNDPTDYNGHGTHVAGTIAAFGDNNSGITGVMWRALIMPLRFLGIHGGGTTSGAIEAIDYANRNGAHIINNSWSGSGYSQLLKDAIDASSALVVCAAGNETKNNDNSPSYPANYSSANIISVAATNQSDELANFSNYGANSVDLAAPGDSIYSSVPTFSYDTPVAVYSQNFDGASGNLPLSGWDRGGTNTTWAVTTGTGVGASNSLEDSPGGNYASNTDSWAGYTVNTVNINPIPTVKNNIYTLSFKWKGALEYNVDFLDINYSTDGTTWDYVDYRTGTQGTFYSDSTTELTLVAEMYPEFYFGFGLYTDYSINNDGVYIDDVTLTRSQLNISSYSYANYNGTSMAAPHVSGVAGLVKALNPSFTSQQIKDAILKTVEPKGVLIGKVASGGRLNALNALMNDVLPKLSYSIVNANVYLSWQDNSSDELGFRILKKAEGSSVFEQLADVGANVISHTDTSGVGGAYSINVYGGNFGNKAYSNVESVSSADIAGSRVSSTGGGGGGGGGCFIGTASYKSFMHRFAPKK